MIKKFDFDLYKQIRFVFVCVKKWFLERKFRSVLVIKKKKIDFG